jgi:mannobiose 2-epimerase
MLGAADHALCTSLGQRLDRLATEVMTFWRTYGPDRQNGGFFGTLDRHGRRTRPFEKGLVQQARHLWAFSSWYARREPAEEIRTICDDLYRFLMERFYSETRREFHFMMSESGPAASDTRKVLYAQAFAIFALCAYARAFGHDQAASRALDTFRAIDSRAHDDENGGYLENNDSGYLADGSKKGFNTHLHLMEALTALVETTGDRHATRRLHEMATVVADKIVQRPVYRSRLEFLDDWTPVGPDVRSWGHDLETSWMLRWTASVLHEPDGSPLLHTALRLGKTAAEDAWDADNGCWFEEGTDDGRPVAAARVWWVQSEALPALWQLYRATSDRKYLDRLDATLSFIENKLRDVKCPGTEWFFSVDPDGSPGPRGDHKGEAWKASYHNSRGLSWTGGWIAEAMRG